MFFFAKHKKGMERSHTRSKTTFGNEPLKDSKVPITNRELKSRVKITGSIRLLVDKSALNDVLST